MNEMDNQLDLMLIEHSIVEALFIGEKYLSVVDKYGRDTILTLTGTHDVLLYKWDIEKCEQRAKVLIDSILILEDSEL